MSNRAILVVDMQNEYFPGGKLPLSGIIPLPPMPPGS